MGATAPPIMMKTQLGRPLLSEHCAHCRDFKVLFFNWFDKNVRENMQIRTLFGRTRKTVLEQEAKFLAPLACMFLMVFSAPSLQIAPPLTLDWIRPCSTSN